MHNKPTPYIMIMDYLLIRLSYRPSVSLELVIAIS